MALTFILLGITIGGTIWVFLAGKKACDLRKQETSIVAYLATEIRKLRKEVDDLKNND